MKRLLALTFVLALLVGAGWKWQAHHGTREAGWTWDEGTWSQVWVD